MTADITTICVKHVFAAQRTDISRYNLNYNNLNYNFITKERGDHLRSIMTDNLEVCYYCGTTENVDIHHCIHGNKKNRDLATQYHLLIGCCQECHRGINGIHGKYGYEKDLKLKSEAQKAWEARRVKKGKSKPETVREEWIKIFGEDYVAEFIDYILECEEDLLADQPEEDILYALQAEIK